LAALVQALAFAGPALELNILEAGTGFKSDLYGRSPCCVLAHPCLPRSDGRTVVQLPDLCKQEAICANCMNKDNSDLFVNPYRSQTQGSNVSSPTNRCTCLMHRRACSSSRTFRSLAFLSATPSGATTATVSA
jgi:hypothetical protein